MAPVAALVAAAAAAAVSRSTIGIQAHSVNDLRLMPQLWRKGVRSFKIDFHWVWENEGACGTKTGGCFLLSHDDPVDGVAYNTSDNIIDALLALPSVEGVRVALCTKPETPAALMCVPTKSNNAWMAALDDYHAKVQATAPLSGVTWVFDGGMAHPLSCLRQKWLPWLVTYVDGRSPPEALTSDDSKMGYDRFAVLNDNSDATRWTELATAAQHYGKFAAASQPYQLWEPDSQKDLQSLADIYLNGTAGVHAAGFDFAINTDPALLRTYLGDRTDSAWNEVVADYGSAVALLSLPSSEGVRLGLVTRGASGGLNWTVLTAAAQYQPLKRSQPTPLPNSSALTGNVSFSSDGATVLALNASCWVQPYTLTPSGAPVAGAGYRAPHVSESATCLAHTAAAGCASDCLIVVAREPSCSGVTVASSKGAVCADVPGAVSAAVVSGDAQKAVAFVSDGVALHGVPVTWGQQAAPSVSIGVGVDPSAVAAGGTVMFVVSGGFCYDSHTHRTQAKPKLCDQTPVQQASTLTYTVAGFDDLHARMLAGQLRLSPCEPGIQHGAWSQGRHPSATTLAGGGFRVAIAHDGYDGSGDGGCGTPLEHAGVVLDSFPLDGSWGG
eukprot:TRINITY_DN12888_c0_g2_i1.p1 TRINITY_DN12888_c0_g2~~TRINITY_DN12888_c0_g2_i1.p1  ORF type:complete len:611 (+),score=188.50 TRINITY_DN12888_c0_g2_i1:56-1888(+)